MLLCLALSLAACVDGADADMQDAPRSLPARAKGSDDYIIGPGDHLQIMVWRNAELSMPIVVRPDGKISAPLIEDLAVAGLTPSQAARVIEQQLGNFVRDVVVTVVMMDFVGPVERQIRVVGEAARPQAMPYRAGMTALDVMVAAGGLTQFAAGNRATLQRMVDGKPVTYRLRLADLLKHGDLSVNAEVAPGDIVLIPQSWF